MQENKNFTLDYSLYVVMVRDGQARVTPNLLNEIRLSTFASPKLWEDYYEHHFQPDDWTNIKLSLAREGVSVKEASELTIYTKGVSDLIKEGLQTAFPVFGVNLDAGLFASSIGLVFAAAAFSLIGPYLALKKSEVGPVDQPWIGAINTTDKPWFIELAAWALTAAWVVIPIAVAVMQFQISINYTLLPVESNLIHTGYLGHLFAVIVGFDLAQELRRLRRMKIAPS